MNTVIGVIGGIVGMVLSLVAFIFGMVTGFELKEREDRKKTEEALK